MIVCCVAVLTVAAGNAVVGRAEALLSLLDVTAVGAGEVVDAATAAEMGDSRGVTPRCSTGICFSSAWSCDSGLFSARRDSANVRCGELGTRVPMGMHMLC